MNKVEQGHPSPDRLAAFGLGRLSDADAAAIEGHLADCAACRQVVASLPPDSFIKLIRASAATPADIAASACTGENPLTTSGSKADDGPQLPPELVDHPRYRILGLLGKGGMGAVYKAEHKLMERTVALKVISQGLVENPTAIARFRREVKAAARLSHNNIVAAHDAEQAGDAHFLVMEYVEGKSLAQLLEEKGPLPVVQACNYIRQAALGLQHAFEQGMVHRDLKPQNLMLTPKGWIKVLDFGLARFASETGRKAALTQENAVMGTPDYIAPEQATDARTADIRADLYSLGCTLYCLLAGHPPFPEGTVMQKILAHLEKQPRPITELRPDVPAELQTVLDKMLAKDPAQRYQKPAEVVQALTPFLKATASAPSKPLAPATAKPVPAQAKAGPGAAPLPPGPAVGVPTVDQLSPVETVGAEGGPRQPKAGSRKPIAVLAVLLGLGLLVWFLAGVVIRIPAGNGTLVIETDDPNVEVIVKQGGATIIDRTTKREIELKAGDYEIELAEVKDGLRLSTKRFTLSRGGREVVRAWLETNVAASPLDLLDPAKIPAEERFNWQPKELVAVLGEHRQRHWEQAFSVAISPDGKLVASGGQDQVIRLWDAATMREQAVLRGRGWVFSVAFAPDGKTLASGGASGGDGPSIRLWDLGGAEPKEKMGLIMENAPLVYCVAFAPDSKILAFGDDSGVVGLWNLAGDKPKQQAVHKGHKDIVDSVSFNPDGKTLASASLDGTVRLWDLAGTQLKERAVLTKQTGGVHAVAFAPDGKTLASGSDDGTVRLWDLAEAAPKEREVLQARLGPVRGLAFTQKGTMLASNHDGGIALWDLNQPAAVQKTVFRAGQASSNGGPSVAFAPDSKTLVSGASIGTVRLWDVTGPEPKERFPLNESTYYGGAYARTLAFAPDGKLLASASLDANIRLWNLAAAAPKEQAVLREHSGRVTSIAFTPDGRTLASGGHAPSLGIWDLSTARLKQDFLLEGEARQVFWGRFTPDGKTLVSKSWDASVYLWQLTGGVINELARFKGDAPGSNSSIALAPDSKTLATGGDKGTVQIWDISGAKLTKRFVFQGNQGQTTSLAFGPSSQTLASAGFEPAVRIWDLAGAEARERVALRVHDLHVYALAFSPDGRMLATASNSGWVNLWEIASAKKLHEWKLPGAAWEVAFAPDGRHLATGNGNGTIYILRLAAAK